MTVTAPKSASRKVPEKIGKYAVINEVGRGSTGIVLPFARRLLRARRCDQGLQHGCRRRRGACAHRPQDVPFRSASRGDASASAHSSYLRRGRRKRPLLHRDGARARRTHPRGVLPARQPASHRRYGRDHLQVREGAALRALARCDPSRHQTFEHHAHERQRRAHHRLRHRARAGLGYFPHRRHRGEPVVHVAGAGAELRAHEQLRPLFARRGDV